MAYNFVAASSQYLSTASAPVSAMPLTIACWARPTDNTIACAYSSLGNSGAQNRFQLYHTSTEVGCSQVSTTGTSSASRTVGVPPTNNVWIHCCGVYTTVGTLQYYLNGSTAGVTNALASIAESTLNQFLIGARRAASIGAYMQGDVADVGIWNVALSVPVIETLAKGFSCRRVRPQSLQYYSPIVRNIQDVRAARAITNNGTATAAIHPRVYA